jgi:hypothetical protein
MYESSRWEDVIYWRRFLDSAHVSLSVPSECETVPRTRGGEKGGVSHGLGCPAALVVRHVGEPALVALRLHAAVALLSLRLALPSHVELSFA